jgi:hypothetical protein
LRILRLALLIIPASSQSGSNPIERLITGQAAVQAREANGGM